MRKDMYEWDSKKSQKAEWNVPSCFMDFARICTVIAANPESDRMCLAMLSMLTCIGFATGMANLGGSAASRLNSVMAALAASYTPETHRSRISRSQRGVFVSSLFAVFPIVRGWCPVFTKVHPLALVLIVFSTISTGIWLMIASMLQNALDSERETRIEEFISTPPGSSPQISPNINPRPRWLKIWQWTNFAAFALFVTTIFRAAAMLVNS